MKANSKTNNEMKKPTPGKTLKTLFESAGYTVTSFAEALNVDRKTVQRRLKEDPMDPDFVASASEILGYDITTVAVETVRNLEIERLEKELAASEAREKELKAQIYDLMKSKGLL
jgi:plasmid maintenance system antidote protein VapI